MTTSPIDEMSGDEIIAKIQVLSEAVDNQQLLIETLRGQLKRETDQKNRDFAAANMAIGAIYKMVELIKETKVTHAQREGNFLLLLAFIDSRWSSHSARYASQDDDYDIPF